MIPVEQDGRNLSPIFAGANAASNFACRNEFNGTDYDALTDDLSVAVYDDRPSQVPEPDSLLMLRRMVLCRGQARNVSAVLCE